jgi:hypothetical protein
MQARLLFSIALVPGICATPQTTEQAPACIPQQSVWKQGIEFRHTLCSPGVDVVVSPIPAPGFMGAPSPVAYMVKIENYSTVRIESDPALWRLLWTEKNGTAREDGTLTERQAGPSRFADRSFGRTTLFTDQSVAGFVYFKKPKSKDATIVIIFDSEQGRVSAQIPVSAVPVRLLP